MNEPVTPRYFMGIDIEINHHCNLACSYCPNSNSERISKGLMSYENFKRIMEQLSDIKYEGRINYHFYSEPTLHPELVNFVKLSKVMLPKSRSEIYSNGTLLSEEKYYELRTAGVDKFTITRHESTKKTAFDNFYEALPESEKKCVKYTDFSQLIYTNRGGLVDAGKKIENSLNRLCLIPMSSLIVTVKGNVVSCYEDFNEKNVMGNVFQEHIKDIWVKPKYQEFRDDLRKGHRYKYEVCKSCNNMQIMQ